MGSLVLYFLFASTSVAGVLVANNASTSVDFSGSMADV